MLTTIGFSAAAVSNLLVAVFVLRLGHLTPPARALITALVVTAAWSIVVALSTMRAGSPALWPWLIGGDAFHAAVWAVFAGTMASAGSAGESPRASTPRGKPLRAAVLVLVAVALLSPLLGIGNGTDLADRLACLAVLGLAILAAICVAEIYRRASRAEPRLLVGMGLLVGAEIAAFSPALWSDGISEAAWDARGFVNAVGAPLVVWGSWRWFQWKSELHISRQVVFHSTSVFAIILYLLVIGVTAWLVLRSPSLAWPVGLVFVAMVALGLYRLLFSEVMRRRTKAFVTKHFYRDRYDYRREWLRLIETLIGRTGDAPIPVRAVKALAEIVGSPQGELWVKTGQVYHGHGSWGTSVPSAIIKETDPLAVYLDCTHWVVDTLEYQRTPRHYSNALDAAEWALDRPAIFVPILHNDALVGIVRLARPPGLGDLSFEDHDLLKTAGQQAAIFLVQERAQQELLETRQFEAYSKLTAFLTHDLKNMIAQQDLVVANARRFKHRPEFIDDAMTTIGASVERMRKILERLQGSTRSARSSRFDLKSLLVEVCKECSDREPVPRLTQAVEGLSVEMDRDGIKMAITHLIRNAQDATPADGRIELRLYEQATMAALEVADSGCGMEPEFIRDRLFRPFDSTKGAQGMGIGAYQIRETLHGAGGDIEVQSQPGVGTTMRVHLPLVPRREVA